MFDGERLGWIELSLVVGIFKDTESRICMLILTRKDLTIQMQRIQSTVKLDENRFSSQACSFDSSPPSPSGPGSHPRLDSALCHHIS